MALAASGWMIAQSEYNGRGLLALSLLEDRGLLEEGIESVQYLASNCLSEAAQTKRIISSRINNNNVIL